MAARSSAAPMASAEAFAQSLTAAEEARLPLAALLGVHEELRSVADPAKRDAGLVTRVTNDDDRALLTYLLSLTPARSEPLVGMLRTLEQRCAQCWPC